MGDIRTGEGSRQEGTTAYKYLSRERGIIKRLHDSHLVAHRHHNVAIAHGSQATRRDLGGARVPASARSGTDSPVRFTMRFSYCGTPPPPRCSFRGPSWVRPDCCCGCMIWNSASDIKDAGRECRRRRMRKVSARIRQVLLQIALETAGCRA